MMRIDFIKYSKSVRTESGDSRVEASARLEKNENPDLAFEDLKKFVHEKIGMKSESPSFNNKPFAEMHKLNLKNE